MSGTPAPVDDQRLRLIELYDSALPEVYGYLASRCGSAAVAEDLTSETFLAAVDSVKRHRVPDLTVAWLIRVARNKLVDHWRKKERDDKAFRVIESEPDRETDPWDRRLDAELTRQTLEQLGAHHRSALTLRYFDDLAQPIEREEPRPSFTRSLRARLVTELGLDDEPPPTVPLPERKSMSTDTATTPPSSASAPGAGGIWASLSYRDAPAGIRFMVDVLGFEEQLVVTHPEHDTVVVHSQLHWPDGGIVSPGTWDENNIYMVPPGQQRLYVSCADPHAVYDRCIAAGVEVVAEPYEPEYDPGGMGFGVKDPEGNIWSFGTYAGGA